MHRFASSVVILAYLAGATAGGLQLSTRHQPVEGLAVQPAYRRVGSTPSTAAPTTQPATDIFELRFRGRPPRSDLGGFSTRDDQSFVVFREGAVPPRRGQTSVQLQAAPLDPAAL